jgi:hypothetical protein
MLELREVGQQKAVNCIPFCPIEWTTLLPSREMSRSHLTKVLSNLLNLEYMANICPRAQMSKVGLHCTD